MKNFLIILGIYSIGAGLLFACSDSDYQLSIPFILFGFAFAGCKKKKEKNACFVLRL